MPRKPRGEILMPGGLYHVVTRGNNQRRIFRSPRDYKKFLQILKETKEKYPFYLYSYNLLSNHYHLEIETIEISISKIMHQINNKYAKYFRKRYGGSGHLFEGRFYCSLVLKEPYFWELAAYIDLNAVRAGLAEHPKDYQWSSYLDYFQKEYKDILVDRDRFLRYGGMDLESARLSYLEFIEEKLKSQKLPPFLIDERMV
jgi:putative transposase